MIENELQKIVSGKQKQSLAKDVLSRARLLGSTPGSSLKIYQLPMSLKFNDDKKRIRRFTSSDNKNNHDTKTVIMVGISGSGKSLMINNIINFMYGVDYKSDFRLKLILEESERNEREQEGTTAMTSWVSAYDLVWQEGFPVNFNLTLIDTPGFADDKGVDYDGLIVDRIKSMFNSKDTLPRQKLDAIGFVIPASTTRLTYEQKYVFDSILNIFGKDLKENVTVLCTFADAQTPPAIETIKKDGIPISSYHKFNNSAVFAPNDDENEEETEYAWKFGHKNVTKFLQALESLNSQKLDITNAVLDEIEGLKWLLMNLKPQIDAGMYNLQKIESMIDEISTLNGTIKQNRDYQVKKSVAEQVTEVVYHDITNCPPCMYTCHDPCKIAGDGKEYCWAMDNGKCRMCPGKCDWDVHKNGDRIYKYEPKEVVETIQDMLDKYNICSNRKDAKQKLLQNILEEYRVLKMKLLEDITAAAAASNRLDQLALRNTYLTNVDYIKRLIETERTSNRPHKQKRIGQLQMVLGMAEILDSAKNNPDVLTSHMSDYERTVHDRIDQLNNEMEDDTPVSGHSSLRSGNRKGWRFGKW